MNLLPIATAAFIALGISVAIFTSGPDPSESLNVAIVGNSMFYYNDCPRVLEAISGGRISQNSTLRPSGSLNTTFLFGNKMRRIFRGGNAVKADGTYDIGAPDVPTLLLGEDYDAEGRGDGGDDDFSSSSSTPRWDFVVMNDFTRGPSDSYHKDISLQALEELYAPLLRLTGAIPVFMSTHWFRPDISEYHGVGDIYNFAEATYQGYEEYAALLDFMLLEEQTPTRIAPVGRAFVRVWEEDVDLWYRLFHTDGVHMSPIGTYLQACVLHCTLFGRAPFDPNVFPTEGIPTLFQRSRFMQTPPANGVAFNPFPTMEEARYLFGVAETVTLDGDALLYDADDDI